MRQHLINCNYSVHIGGSKSLKTKEGSLEKVTQQNVPHMFYLTYVWRDLSTAYE